MKIVIIFLLLVNIRYIQIYGKPFKGSTEPVFLLYKRFFENNNNSCNINPTDINIESPALNFELATIFLIPSQTITNDAFIKLREELLIHGKYNIIFVDWSNFNNGETEVDRIRSAAARVAEFILKIAGHGPINNIHMIGFGSGAHLAGFVGKFLNQNSPGLLLTRITGLDPSSDGFKGVSCQNRLDKSDAKFVDIVHTCDNKLGLDEAIGNVDFFINGGFAPQPGCNCDIDGTCSHLKALEFFTDSINKCSWKAHNCCSKKGSITFGFHCPLYASGDYCFSTKKKCKPRPHKPHCQ